MILKKIVLIVSFLIIMGCQQKNEIVSYREHRFIGVWQTIQGNAEYIDISIDEGKRDYRSFLHNHIFELGEWELDNSMLKVIFADMTTNVFRYFVTNNFMVLSNINGSVEIYKRYKE